MNIYKPAGMTSFSCVSRVRRLTKSDKAGHGGTLDPQATGVLPVCIGRATKCADLFLTMPKRYRGEVTFGVGTDTCDIWGTAITEMDIRDAKLLQLTCDTVKRTTALFRGVIRQIPPDYAAIKINGVPAYKLARQGKTVELKSRDVTIYEIEIVHFTGGGENTYPKAVIDVKCSKGTYIRSLFRDIGEKIGVPACMSALERTEYGFLKSDCAISLDDLKDLCERGEKPLPFYAVDALMQDYARITLNEKEEKLYRCGVRVRITDCGKRIAGKIAHEAPVRIYTQSGRLLATAKLLLYDNTIAELKPDKFFDCGEVML